MKRGPLTLLSRRWIVPVGSVPFDLNANRWPSIPPIHVIIERNVPGGKELIVEFNDRRILCLECNHPAFYGWLSGLIDSLAAALDEECSIDSLYAETVAEPEWLAKRSRSWPTEMERDNDAYEIPAGATPIWDSTPLLVRIAEKFCEDRERRRLLAQTIFPGLVPPSK